MNNSTLVNASDLSNITEPVSYYDRFSLYRFVFFYYIPVMCVIGMVGNLISLAAFIRKFKEYKSFLSIIIIIGTDCFNIICYEHFALVAEVATYMTTPSYSYAWAIYKAYIPLPFFTISVILILPLLVVTMLQRIRAVKQSLAFSNENHVKSNAITFGIALGVTLIFVLPYTLPFYKVVEISDEDGRAMYMPLPTFVLSESHPTLFKVFEIGAYVSNGFRLLCALSLVPLTLYFSRLLNQAQQIKRPILHSNATPAQRIQHQNALAKYKKQKNGSTTNTLILMQSILVLLSETISVMYISMMASGVSPVSYIMITTGSIGYMVKLFTATINLPFYYLLSSEFRKSLRELRAGKNEVTAIHIHSQSGTRN